MAFYGGNVFETNQWTYTVGEYNATTGAAVNASLIGSAFYCNGIAISSTGSLYFDEDSNGGYLWRNIRPEDRSSTPAFSRAWPVPGRWQLSGSILYVAHNSSTTVGEYDANSGAVINASFITGLNAPNGRFISGSTLFVTNSGSGSIGEYNAVSGAVINANFVTGLNNPGSVAVMGNNLYVSNSVANAGYSIGEYDATTGAPISTLSSTDCPRA